MTPDDSPAARRIMDSLGEEYRVPIVNIAEGDVGVLVGAPVAGLLLATLLGVDALALPLVCAGLAAGVAAVVAAPSHRSAWAWLRTVARFYLLRPRATLFRAADSDHAATQGGVVQYTPFTPDERTQDLIGIERAWPGADAVERPDGTLEAYLELHPSTMEFAMSDDWAQVQAAAADFANAELDFPLTLHVTTRSFPAAQLVAQLDDRLADPDVQAAPTFQELIDTYRERRPADLADTQQLHYYLGVAVTPRAIHRRQQAEPPPAEKLAEVPVVGLLCRPFVTRGTNHSPAERRAAMLDLLDARLRTVRSGFIEEVPGWSATRLSTLELVTLAADFWNGTEHDPDEASHLLREAPVLGPAAGDAAADGAAPTTADGTDATADRGTDGPAATDAAGDSDDATDVRTDGSSPGDAA